MSEWTYKGKPLSDADIPEKAVGFIYTIVQKSTKKKYIGRKLMTMAGQKMVAGKKKKIRKESNWRSYWSSSPWLIDYIKEHGTDDFTREIIVFCEGKGSMAYIEECLLYTLGALESPNWLNENIRSKVYRTWISKDGKTKPEIQVMRDYIKSQS
jgi:hypothetical protein